MESVKNQQGGSCSAGKPAGFLRLFAQNNKRRIRSSTKWIFLVGTVQDHFSRYWVSKICSQDPALTQADYPKVPCLLFNMKVSKLKRSEIAHCREKQATTDRILVIERFLDPVGTEASTQSSKKKRSLIYTSLCQCY